MKSDWLSAVLVSALIGQYAPSHARAEMAFFTASKISCVLVRKRPKISQIMLELSF